MGIPFVTSVPIRRNGATAMVPEPNFPAQPDEFVGRDTQIEAFRQVLAQGLLTGRTPSFAVLGDWGVGKSSLLLKYSAICSKPEHAMLPVFFSVSTELSDYKCFAESLLDTFTRTLETSDSLTTQFRNELQKWKLSRLSIGGVSLDRQGPEFFLTSGTAILKHALHDAWRQFVRPAQITGVIFFLDDLHNFTDPRAQGIALALRNQFQEFAIHGVNYSLRFYDKVYLSSFTVPETREYTAAVFGDSLRTHHLSQWLYAKTFGHPYFLAFVSRQLLALAHGSLVDPEALWPAIFKRLEHEKFRSDLAQVTEREVQLLREVAKAGNDQSIRTKILQPPDRKGSASSRRSRSLQTLSPTLPAVSTGRMIPHAATRSKGTRALPQAVASERAGND